MAGIRLHHPNPVFRNITYVVESGEPMERRRICPTCRVDHRVKAIHLHLDAQGDVIVSKEVYEKLLLLQLAGLEVANEVENPPPLRVGAVESPTTEIVSGNGHRFYVPGKTKYESGEIAQKAYQPLIDQLTDMMDKRETAKLRKKGWKAYDMGRGKQHG